MPDFDKGKACHSISARQSIGWAVEPVQQEPGDPEAIKQLLVALVVLLRLVQVRFAANRSHGLKTCAADGIVRSIAIGTMSKTDPIWSGHHRTPHPMILCIKAQAHMRLQAESILNAS